MNVIYRFPIDMREAADNGARFTIELPLGAKVIHVDLQQRAPHQPSMWVLLNPEDGRPPVERTFEIVGTGHLTEHAAPMHVATWQQDGYVWHLFEVPTLEAAVDRTAQSRSNAAHLQAMQQGSVPKDIAD